MKDTSRDSILQIKDIRVDYKTRTGWFSAVNGVSFDIGPDEVFGIVGESGSGKSTMCMGLLRLLPETAKCGADRMDFTGRDLLGMKEGAFRRVRWEEISYIPQSAMNTLNPVRRIGKQFWDTMLDHEGKRPRAELEKRVADALERVNLPADVAAKYPHELSGGMKQRVCIAMATLLRPKLIIADEPTSALDVISQRTVLEILSKTRKEIGASMIMIGHDMALQAQIADRMGIMYAGYFVEVGPVRSIFEQPVHPYTQRLIKAIPSIRQKQDIHTMASFELSEEDRERYKQPRPLVEVAEGHYVAEYK